MRGEGRIAREELTESLTRRRDGVRDLLAARARERGLPRDWPDTFFRTTTRSTGAGGADDEPEAAAETTPGELPG